MKYKIICVLLIFSLNGKTQPLLDCAKTTTYKKLFIKSNQNLYSNLSIGNASPSVIDSSINCFKIDYSDIKDSLGNIYFDFKIYRTVENFSDNHWKKKEVPCMHIYICGLKFTDSTNQYYNDTFIYYIEIPKFLDGEYWIDITSKVNSISVPCSECIENHESKEKYISAINITPLNWYNIKTYNNTLNR